MNTLHFFLISSLVIVTLTILLVHAEQDSAVREVRAADGKHVKNGTKSGTTPKPGPTTTGKSKSGRATTRKFGGSNRPRAPITGKPVDNVGKPKPKPLSPLLAPRNPKHTTTTTESAPEEEEYEDEE